MNPGWT